MNLNRFAGVAVTQLWIISMPLMLCKEPGTQVFQGHNDRAEPAVSNTFVNPLQRFEHLLAAMAARILLP